MDWELLRGSLEMFILEIMSMMSVWDMVKCTGQMDQYTKVNGKREYSMEEAL